MLILKFLKGIFTKMQEYALECIRMIFAQIHVEILHVVYCFF